MQTRRWGHGIFENNNNKLQQILYAYPAQNSYRLEIVIPNKRRRHDSQDYSPDQTTITNQFQETDGLPLIA